YRPPRILRRYRRIRIDPSATLSSHSPPARAPAGPPCAAPYSSLRQRAERTGLRRRRGSSANNGHKNAALGSAGGRMPPARASRSASQAASLALTKSTRDPTVAKVAPSISSSATTNPKCSSSEVISVATAIESSSGMLPSIGVSGPYPAERAPRFRTRPTMEVTSRCTSNSSLLRFRAREVPVAASLVQLLHQNQAVDTFEMHIKATIRNVFASAPGYFTGPERFV